MRANAGSSLSTERTGKKALKRHGTPEVITTDGLRPYKAAMAETGNAGKQEVGRWADNRVENSHLPFRRRERAMLRFRQNATGCSSINLVSCRQWPLRHHDQAPLTVTKTSGSR